jgi:hypothetical protein
VEKKRDTNVQEDSPALNANDFVINFFKKALDIGGSVRFGLQ